MIYETSPIQFKSANFNVYSSKVILHTSNLEEIREAIDEHIKKSGLFFKNEYIAIDAKKIEQKIDWLEIIKIFKNHEINILGVIANNENIGSAIKIGLAPLEIITNNVKTNTQTQELTTLTIDKPLRSGQKIYAKKSDLIVIGMVSQGAEVIADGNIHVYGPLRGKAIAGAQGNDEAKIFTTHLDPELLAISGVYKIIDNNIKSELHNKPAIIKLINDELVISRI